MEITKKQFAKALADNKIYIAGTHRNKNGWVRFKVFMLTAGELREITIKTQYSSNKYHSYQCAGFGTDRILEIVLAIGYKLGLKFHEIPQNWHWLSEE